MSEQYHVGEIDVGMLTGMRDHFTAPDGTWLESADVVNRLNDLTARLAEAEAERDMWRNVSLQAASKELHKRLTDAEQKLATATAALEEINRLLKSQSDVFLLRVNTVAVTALAALTSVAVSGSDSTKEGVNNAT